MLVHHRTTVRCGAAVAAACLGLLLPTLVAPPASAAGSTSVVTVEPLGHSGTGAAGVCLLYRVVPRDGAYEESVTAAGQGQVTVALTELGELAQQDVDFCTVGGRGDVFSRAPRYSAGQESAPTTQLYNPGETRTPEEPGNPTQTRQDVPPAVTTTNPAGRPDVAAVEPATTATPANNVKSTDSATVGYDRDAGGFVVGVVGLVAGSARISAFFDRNGDGDADTAAPTPIEPGGDVHAEGATVQFSPGGAPWSLTAANAARTVEATPRTATVVAGSSTGAALSAVVRNAEGHPIAGVMPRLTAEDGPNAGSAPTWTGSCGATDSTGRASCSYAAGSVGTDTVVLWVNQAVSGASSGRDEGEPFDRVSVQAQAPSGTLPTASPSSTGSPTAAASPSPTSAASPTAAPASPTPADTPSPTPAARECATALTVERSVMSATQETRVVVHGAAGQVVQLLAYSRPSTSYRVVREDVTGPDGRAVFAIRPLTNTRLYAAEQDCPDSPSQVVQVRSALSLGATRVGVRDIAFRGRVVPARAGQLVSLYRVTTTGRQVLAGQTRADTAGTWALRRVFSGTGRFGFVARTGSDITNAAGTSPIRVVDIR